MLEKLLAEVKEKILGVFFEDQKGGQAVRYNAEGLLHRLDDFNLNDILLAVQELTNERHINSYPENEGIFYGLNSPLPEETTS